MKDRTWLVASGWLLAVFCCGAVSVMAQGEGGRGPQGGKKRPDKAPKMGDAAPDFTLKTLDGEQEVRLSEELKKQPVVLIFGSYT